MQVDPAAEPVLIAWLQPLLPACISAGPGELLHAHDGHAVGVCIERACAAGAAETVQMGVQLFPDPLDAGLDQRDEVEMRMEELRQVLLRVVAIIRYDLGLVYADGRKLLQRILYRDDVRLVAGLLRECDRLPCPNRIKYPAASNGVSSLQRCRAAGYLTLAAFANWPCKHGRLAHCSRE